MKNFLATLLTFTIILVVLAVGYTAVKAINNAQLTNLTNSLIQPVLVAPEPIIITATPAPAAPPAAAPVATPLPVVDGRQAVGSEPPAVTVQDTAVEYDPEFLLACWTARDQGRRVSPKCPGNEAELLGVGR